MGQDGSVVEQWSPTLEVMGSTPSHCTRALWQCINPYHQVPMRGLKAMSLLVAYKHTPTFLADRYNKLTITNMHNVL